MPCHSAQMIFAKVQSYLTTLHVSQFNHNFRNKCQHIPRSQLTAFYPSRAQSSKSKNKNCLRFSVVVKFITIKRAICITVNSAPNFHPHQKSQKYFVVVWQIRASLRGYGVFVWGSVLGCGAFDNRQGLPIVKPFLKRGTNDFRLKRHFE